MIGIDCFFVSGQNNNPLDDYNYTIVLEDKIAPEEVLHLQPETILLFKCSNSQYE